MKNPAMNYKEIAGVRYYLVVYKKVLADLPILNIKERQLRYIFSELEKKKILSRNNDCSNYLYININNLLLVGNFLQTSNQKLPTIDKLNNIIKIKTTRNARTCVRNSSAFLLQYKEILKKYVTSISFDLWFKQGLNISGIEEDSVVFEVKNIDAVKRLQEPMSRALEETLEKWEENYAKKCQVK